MGDFASILLLDWLGLGLFGLFEWVNAERIAAVDANVGGWYMGVFFCVCGLRERSCQDVLLTTVNCLLHSEQIINSPTPLRVSPGWRVGAACGGVSRSSELMEEALARFRGGWGQQSSGG